MALKYPSHWKFEGVGFPISNEACGALYNLIIKIATGADDPKWVIEEFKSSFGATGGSSTYDWAITDLTNVMWGEQQANAAAFVDAYWSTIEALKEKGIDVPSAKYINDLLHQHDVPLTIKPPHLVLESVDSILLEGEGAGTGNSYAVSNYRLGDKLGEGGFGVVYRARRVTAVGEFDFAVKVLDPSAFTKDKEKALARFKREVRALRQLQHRAIVPYFDAGLGPEGKPYLVMPLIEGKDLRSETEGMELQSVLHLFIEVLAGLSFAHSKGVLHRDLKPSNIIVRESDTQPIILDFGCAYLLDEAGLANLTTAAVGSQGYIPSEVIAEPTRRTPQHDIFSSGIILYEMLARRQPDPREYKSLSISDPSFAIVDNVVQRAIAPATSRFTAVDDLLEATMDCYAKCEGSRFGMCQ